MAMDIANQERNSIDPLEAEPMGLKVVRISCLFTILQAGPALADSLFDSGSQNEQVITFKNQPSLISPA